MIIPYCMDIRSYMKKIKIHQYKGSFIEDIRFWIETIQPDDMYHCSWFAFSRMNMQTTEESGLLDDTDHQNGFIYNGVIRD